MPCALGSGNVSQKTYRLAPGEIRPLVVGLGACFATDMITVGGMKVAFMYREAPDSDVDSGWRFTSGYESDAYMEDPENHEIYDVNTIANYDPDIIPLLGSPEGSAFERTGGNGPLTPVDFNPPE